MNRVKGRSFTNFRSCKKLLTTCPACASRTIFCNDALTPLMSACASWTSCRTLRQKHAANTTRTQTQPSARTHTQLSSRQRHATSTTRRHTHTHNPAHTHTQPGKSTQQTQQERTHSPAHTTHTQRTHTHTTHTTHRAKSRQHHWCHAIFMNSLVVVVLQGGPKN